jgi:hypothetical protein
LIITNDKNDNIKINLGALLEPSALFRISIPIFIKQMRTPRDKRIFKVMNNNIDILLRRAIVNKAI